MSCTCVYNINFHKLSELARILMTIFLYALYLYYIACSTVPLRRHALCTTRAAEKLIILYNINNVLQCSQIIFLIFSTNSDNGTKPLEV